MSKINLIKKFDVLCIGCQKCGTKLLREIFRECPYINCFPKERGIFNRPRTSKDIKIMEDFIDSSKINCKVTPQYIYSENALNIIKQNNKIKLIILIREPVTRTFSQYNYKKIFKKTKKQFIDWINNTKNYNGQHLKKISKVNRQKLMHEFPILKSSYFSLINNLLEKKNIDKNNIYICIYEKLINNQDEEFRKIFKFLKINNVEKYNVENNEILKKHRTKYQRNITDSEFKYVYNIIKSDKNNLYKLLGNKINEWEDIYKKYNIN